MAPPAERPPSERGPEYQALDAIAELSRKVDELAERPAIALPGHSNWWDVLPALGHESLASLIGDMGCQWLQLPARNPAYVMTLQALLQRDRLELSLRLNGGHMLWQRALFYAPPMVA